LAEIGQVLGGRYRLVELIGQGGMATIYRATDTGLGRDVALKLLRPEYLRDPDFASRFRQEAQAAASLSHPNVVTVYDYGADPSGPFIVMELVDGEDLATILRRSGALPPRQAARIGSAVARALAAAHVNGLIHRDVKPGNILIGRDGRVKVADFGIARAVAEAEMTLPGMTLGSVHYFSPEQARGESATAASDIFSLGIVLFEMLTGVRPWEGDSAAGVALARLTGPTPDPVTLRPSVPPELSSITRRALAGDPIDRYASAGMMADALDGWLAATAPATTAGATGVAGAAAAGAVAGAAMAGAGPMSSPTVVSATARPNPTAVPYDPAAYATADDAAIVSGTSTSKTAGTIADEDTATSPLVWVAGILAIALLAAIAFLVFQLISGNRTAAPTQVVVPNFVGTLVSAASERSLTRTRHREGRSTREVP
jgi:serine/threonine-protein kinase